jgi:hypothetical protein
VIWRCWAIVLGYGASCFFDLGREQNRLPVNSRTVYQFLKHSSFATIRSGFHQQERAMADQVQWQLSGDYFENCNCSVVCPCLVSKAAPLTSRPTEGVCDVPLIFHIESGSYGAVALDGLNVALAIHTPGPMAEGNWSVAAYIDQRADDKQTEALGAIFTGAAGGPMAALAPLIGKNLGVSKVATLIELKARSVPRKSRASCTCLLIRCRLRIQAAKCGRIPAIRSAPKNWHSPWERQGIRFAITACVGIIPARTDITRRSTGQIVPDAFQDSGEPRGPRHS